MDSLNGQYRDVNVKEVLLAQASASLCCFAPCFANANAGAEGNRT
ncbi:hypothetical protein [Microcoleus sp. FACHB-SPT15]|nr:hypothetical protein [Microcoleus sp. FACHB-SPT15]